MRLLKEKNPNIINILRVLINEKTILNDYLTITNDFYQIFKKKGVTAELRHKIFSHQNYLRYFKKISKKMKIKMIDPKDKKAKVEAEKNRLKILEDGKNKTLLEKNRREKKGDQNKKPLPLKHKPKPKVILTKKEEEKRMSIENLLKEEEKKEEEKEKNELNRSFTAT